MTSTNYITRLRVMIENLETLRNVGTPLFNADVADNLARTRARLSAALQETDNSAAASTRAISVA